MKKLFTYFMLWLTAVSNNVAFEPLDVIEYDVTNDYYNGSLHEQVDYAKIYEDYVGGGNGSENCRLARHVPENLSSQVTGVGSNFYWFVLGKDFPSKKKMRKDDAVKLGCTDSNNIIIAPSKCVIKTNAEKSEYGTTMTIVVGDDLYTVEFTNMDRWFCCLKRDASEKAGKTGFTHSSNAYNYVLERGDILGVGTPDTKVRVYRGSDTTTPVTLQDFYNGL